jgi:hypothetical protein
MEDILWSECLKGWIPVEILLKNAEINAKKLTYFSKLNFIKNLLKIYNF